MTVRLTIRTAVWRSNVARIAGSVDGLVPVVKGNGYGFGRRRLAEIAAEFCDTVAVGTLHEASDLPPQLDLVVLTPTLVAPETRDVILTVGNTEHIATLGEWGGRVIVKLASPMQRYGRDVELVDRARAAGLDVIGVGVHLPLAGSDGERADVVGAMLPAIDPALPVWLSHLSPQTYAQLPSTHHYRLRLGTALWHGNRDALHLTADVLDVRPVANGDRAGYRCGPVPGPGHLVMIGAGTAHGVTPREDGASPFHFERRRIALHEAPHMHTSMAFVPAGDSVPVIGERVDVQRPLHMTAVDDYEWL